MRANAPLRRMPPAALQIKVPSKSTSWGCDPRYPVKSLEQAARQFPNIQHLHFDYFGSEWARSCVLEGLAALPSGCWPAAERVTTSFRQTIPAPWAAHLARLCPRLQEALAAGCVTGDRDALAAALGGPGELRALHLKLWLAVGCPPRDTACAAAALARLTGLRRLRLDLASLAPGAAAGGVAAALPALASLSELELAFGAAAPEIKLAGCPPSLRVLKLEPQKGLRGLDVLASADPLPGVTRLELSAWSRYGRVPAFDTGTCCAHGTRGCARSVLCICAVV